MKRSLMVLLPLAGLSVVSAAPAPSAEKAAPATEWKTYADPSKGFEIGYPAGWKLSESPKKEPFFFYQEKNGQNAFAFLSWMEPGGELAELHRTRKQTVQVGGKTFTAATVAGVRAFKVNDAGSTGSVRAERYIIMTDPKPAAFGFQASTPELWSKMLPQFERMRDSLRFKK